MEKLRIGVVGAGNIAVYAHLPAYKQCSNCIPVAICDIDIEKAKSAAEAFNIPAYYSSVDEMLENYKLIEEMDSALVAENSLSREFIGGSSYASH